MTATTVSDGTRLWLDGKEVRAPLPAYVRDELEHIRVVMAGPGLPVSLEAGIAEWAHVWDCVNGLLDPDYDDGWRPIGVQP